MEKICSRCGRTNKRFTKGVCFNCYRRFFWLKKKRKCKNCGKECFIHAKEYCPKCYRILIKPNYARNYNHIKKHNISIEIYYKITKRCAICNFDKAVDLHHLDENRKNNSLNNLIGLCPNHHRMIHNLLFKNEIITQLNEYKII
tara:strand:+ start:332 stop:763 length:432 start_codon:yes stop_codon:yes gene_type:complete